MLISFLFFFFLNGSQSKPLNSWALATGEDALTAVSRETLSSIIHTIALISHASKEMLKILQLRLQQYMNCELPGVQAGFRKGREPEIKLPTFDGSLKKQESSRKSSISALLRLWLRGSLETVENSEGDGNTRPPDLLRNLYAGQETTVRIGHGTTDWFLIWKGVCQGCILSPCLFNLYADYIMRNTGLWSTSWNWDCWEKYQ